MEIISAKAHRSNFQLSKPKVSCLSFLSYFFLSKHSIRDKTDRNYQLHAPQKEKENKKWINKKELSVRSQAITTLSTTLGRPLVTEEMCRNDFLGLHFLGNQTEKGNSTRSRKKDKPEKVSEGVNKAQ